MAARRVRLEEVLLATQQLSVLLENGVNIVPALSALGRSGSVAVRELFEEVEEAISEGQTLSRAMARRADAFPPLYLRSIRAAEQTGRLVASLRSLSQQLGRQLQARRRLRSALTYPLCVSVAAGLMMAFLLYVQVPIFLRLFQETGAELPAITRALILLSRPELAWLGLLGFLTLGLYGKHLESTPEGRRNLRSFVFSLPGVGPVLRLSALGQFSGEMSTLLNNGVDLVGGLRCLAAGEAGSPYLEALPRVMERIQQGETLTEALDSQVIYPPLLLSLLRAGEETGRNWQGFAWYSQLCLQEMEDRLDLLLQLVEPLIMGALGMAVTLIALATFMPTYQLLLEQ